MNYIINIKPRLIITLLFLFSISYIKAQKIYKELTLEDIHSDYKFYPYLPDEFTFMNDDKHYLMLANYGFTIDKYSIETGEKTSTFFRSPKIENKMLTIKDFEISADESKIMIEVNKEVIYRHSFRAEYYVYDRIKDTLIKVFDEGKIQLATFSPDGLKVAFVWENNLYIKNLTNNATIRVTKDGKKNHIINGMPDWVYEEEFSFNKAFVWSPDSRKIGFMKFDESRVKEYSMVFYDSLYPDIHTFKYPKAGEENAIVSLHIYNLETNTSLEIKTGPETDKYYPRIKWTKDENTLCIIELNRLQNEVKVLFADVNTGDTKVIYTEKEDQYISEIDDNFITFTDDAKYFIITSERDGYRHLYRYDINGEQVNQVTSGKWEIEEMYGCSTDGVVYYRAYDNSALRTSVFSIQMDGSGKEKLSQQKGTNRAIFSTNFNYYIHYHSSTTASGLVTIHNIENTLSSVIEDNKHTSDAMNEYGFTTKEFFTFTNSDGIELDGYMIKPPDFKKGKKYPLFIYVYGGPESNTVTDNIDFIEGWFQYLAQKGYIVATVDGRNADGKGESFRKSTYMKLGKLETFDQIDAAKYLGNLPYIDEHRIGIFGWSYGGYLTLLCMSKAAEIFKMGIAVAPVTNWRFYDTIYTERFMRTPQENPNGYDVNSPITHVEKLEGKLLLIHGMTDDNVHMQNTTEYINMLVEAGKEFDLLIYPNRNHSIYGGNARLHLFRSMSEFIFENL